MSSHAILISFGNTVRELRKARGITQEELSFRADLHRTYIGMIERGEKNITLLNLQKIARALDINLTGLFNETEHKLNNDNQQ